VNFPNGYLVTDEVEINLDMHRALMLNGVGRQVDDTDIVVIENCARDKQKCSSMSNWRSQQVSTTPLATTRHFASALERDNVLWLLEDQEMRLSPRKTAYPEVDRRVSRHPA
jgi:hypothetical protein